MQNISRQFSSIEQVTGQYLKTSKINDNQNITMSFEDVLKNTREKVDDSSNLRFSKHAMERLNDRNIDLTKDQLSRLEQGAQKAGTKGIKESLVLMDDLAFIVNIKSNTVITAMTKSIEDENIYTNIDGAVVI